MVERQDRRAQIEAQAAEWLARLDAGEPCDGAFEAWRDADPAHAVAFVQLRETWRRFERARALHPGGAPNPDLFASPKAPRSRRWLLRAAGLATLAAAGLGGGILIMGERAYAETGIGERRAVRLPDGTLLDLNTNSRASWRVNDDVRDVWLERGEAALEVSADPRGRPFTLIAAGGSVRLEQGVFNARLRGDEAQIVVLRRENAQASPQANLTNSEALLVSAAGQTSWPLTPARVDAAGAWRRGEIVFSGETLGEAVAEYNRYLPQPIEIRDETIASLRVGGRFTTRDPEDFLAAADNAFGVHASRRGDGVIELTRADYATGQ